jgi:hypothetical protein
MDKLNKVVLVISILVLANIIFQALYFKLSSAAYSNDILTDIISFIGNFNFISMVIIPAILFVYSIVTLVMKQKYALGLFMINLCSALMFFAT